MLYADLCGPSHVSQTQGYSCYLSILNDFCRFIWICPLLANSNALQVFTEFKTFIEVIFINTLKIVEIDLKGEEFRNFSSLFSQSNIHFRHSCPHIYHQNRKIRRKQRHIIDTGLILIA